MRLKVKEWLDRVERTILNLGEHLRKMSNVALDSVVAKQRDYGKQRLV